eukprot:6730335-Pyramimonas_sp.AAC.1
MVDGSLFFGVKLGESTSAADALIDRGIVSHVRAQCNQLARSFTAPEVDHAWSASQMGDASMWVRLEG